MNVDWNAVQVLLIATSGGVIGAGLQYVFNVRTLCGRHNYAPRWDRIHYKDEGNAQFRDVYVRDVCTQCGSVRERDEGSD
jgi:hypothetical protein